MFINTSFLVLRWISLGNFVNVIYVEFRDRKRLLSKKLDHDKSWHTFKKPKGEIHVAVLLTTTRFGRL